MSESTILILAALVVILLIVWILRSRSNPNHHIDTSVTAVGAVSEAVRDMAEDVAKAVTNASKADVEASGAEADDKNAASSNAAAIMASAGAVTGTATFADVGAPASTGEADNLRLLKGVGPKLAALLTSIGVTRFDQIAAWEAADVTRVDAQLGNFKGRIARDNWIEQARFLATGDVAGFEARFGKLDSASNS